MKILRTTFSALRNEEHFQFCNEFKSIVEQFDPVKLGIDNLFTKYLELHNAEMDTLNIIRKSVASDQLIVVDTERDEIFRGLADLIKANMYNRNSVKKESATKLNILLKTYGNVARKPYQEETAALIKLIFELRNNFVSECATLDLNDWINDLEHKNNEFDQLMKVRYSEDAGKTDLVLREMRSQIDLSVKGIITMIEALCLVNGLTAYESFIREYNARIEKYDNLMAARKGRSSAKAAAQNLL